MRIARTRRTSIQRGADRHRCAIESTHIRRKCAPCATSQNSHAAQCVTWSGQGVVDLLGGAIADRCTARHVSGGPMLVVLARRGPAGKVAALVDPLVAPSRWAGIAADRRPYASATRSAGLHRPVPGRGSSLLMGRFPSLRLLLQRRGTPAFHGRGVSCARASHGSPKWSG